MIQNYAIIIVHLLWCGRTTRMALCEDWLFDYNTDWTVQILLWCLSGSLLDTVFLFLSFYSYGLFFLQFSGF